jgi:hypothetical protein
VKPAFLFWALILGAAAWAQEPTPVEGEQEELTLVDRIWLSGQINIVNQSHPSFSAGYSGPNSFRQTAEQATTGVATIYTGFRLGQNTDFIFDVESARGAGVSGALGLGGLLNLDAVTDHTATAAPYIARAHFRHTIAFTKKTEPSTRNPLSLDPFVPSTRLEIRVGKMSVADFFDLNSIGSDSHLQFLNYAIDNNAAYDFAANSRGYSYGVLFEFYHPGWAARFAEMLEPTDTAGLKTDWNITRRRSENYEFELHPSLFKNRSSILRVSSFVNHADAASYRDALNGYLSGQDPTPDLGAHLKPGQKNYGLGVNGEQELTESLRIFGRLGWNLGSKEVFQFAEADRTLALGGDFGGKRWHRERDRVGLAMAINGLADAHRQYLELGGSSYLLGDKGLNYGREKIVEGYYNFRLRHGVFLAFDLQHVRNPGYNSSRGPVWIFGLRLHLEGEIHPG